MTRILITGAGGSATANVLDALRQSHSDYFVLGADVSPVRLHLSEADERCILPRCTAPDYIDTLVRAIDRWAIEMVHPQPDPEVLAIGAAREALNARTLLPSQVALTTAADKVAFASAMRAAGVEVPESRDFEDRDSVGAVVEDLLTRHERVWVRARVGAGARASLPVRSADQAIAWVSWWAAEKNLSASQFMAAEMLPGREFAYQSLWLDGALIAGQARERIEYLYGFLTPSGQTSTPSVARTVAEPDVDAIAMNAIAALDPSPHGVYCVDLKTDANDRVKVTEINAGRFFTTSNFFAHAGLNMPDLLVRAGLGERLTPVGTSPLEPDLYWVRMVDMGYILVRGQELDTWPRP